MAELSGEEKEIIAPRPRCHGLPEWKYIVCFIIIGCLKKRNWFPLL